MIDRTADTRREVSRTIRIVRVLGRQLYKSELPRMAAALAYRTLFSMIPVLVLSLVLLGAFATPERVEEAVDRLIEYTGLSEIVIDPGTGPDAAPPAVPGESSPTQPNSTQPSPAGGGSASTPAKEAGSPSPETGPASGDEPAASEPSEAAQGQRLEDWIASLVGRVQTLPFRALGVVGVLLLFYAAISMFVEVERSFNQITRSPRGRSWARRIPLYWTTITLGAVFLLASFYVGDQFKQWVAELISEGGGFGSIVLCVVGFIVTVCISALLLLILYTTVPASRVSVRSASAGALLAAVLWEGGKWGFTRYLEFSTGYVTVYGSIALLLLFLLWVYLTWLIVLFGLQVAVALHGYERFERERQQANDAGLAHEDPVAVLRLATAAAQSFDRGKPSTIDGLAEAVGIRPITAERIAESLVRVGVLVRLESGDDDRLTLARPAERIELRAIIDAAGRDESASHDLGRAADHWADRLRTAQREACAGATLAEAAGLSPGLKPGLKPGPETTETGTTPRADAGTGAEPGSSGSSASSGSGDPRRGVTDA